MLIDKTNLFVGRILRLAVEMFAYSAQNLAYFSAVPFIGLFVALIVGTTKELGKTGTRLIVVTAVSCCAVLNLTAGILYFWHHFFR